MLSPAFVWPKCYINGYIRTDGLPGFGTPIIASPNDERLKQWLPTYEED